MSADFLSFPFPPIILRYRFGTWYIRRLVIYRYLVDEMKSTGDKMAALGEFDRLNTNRVPHILENIFLSLDCRSLMNCLEVSKCWNDLLTTKSFLRMGKSVFCEDLQKML